MMGRSLSLMELGRLEEQVAPTRRSHQLFIGSSRIDQPGGRANAGNPVAQARPRWVCVLVRCAISLRTCLARP